LLPCRCRAEQQLPLTAAIHVDIAAAAVDPDARDLEIPLAADGARRRCEAGGGCLPRKQRHHLIASEVVDLEVRRGRHREHQRARHHDETRAPGTASLLAVDLRLVVHRTADILSHFFSAMIVVSSPGAPVLRSDLVSGKRAPARPGRFPARTSREGKTRRFDRSAGADCYA